MSANIEDDPVGGVGGTGADCLCRCVPCAVGRHGDCRKASFDWCGDQYDHDPEWFESLSLAPVSTQFDLEDTEEL